MKISEQIVEQLKTQNEHLAYLKKQEEKRDARRFASDLLGFLFAPIGLLLGVLVCFTIFDFNKHFDFPVNNAVANVNVINSLKKDSVFENIDSEGKQVVDIGFKIAISFAIISSFFLMGWYFGRVVGECFVLLLYVAIPLAGLATGSAVLYFGIVLIAYIYMKIIVPIAGFTWSAICILFWIACWGLACCVVIVFIVFFVYFIAKHSPRFAQFLEKTPLAKRLLEKIGGLF